MAKSEEIDRERVKQEFSRRILRLGDQNAVLDANPGALNAHQNIYRDYITKKALVKYLQPAKNDVILDFGCGMGRLSRYLAPSAAEIVGVDVSPEMIAAAEIHKPANTRFVVIDSNELEFPRETFDKIFSVWVFQHISDSDTAAIAQSFKKIVKPGGMLVLLEQVRPVTTVFDNIHIQRTLADYRRLFEPAGFEMISAGPVLRMPSLALDLWKKARWLPLFSLPLFRMVENIMINRKPGDARYFTRALVFRLHL